MQRVMTNTRAKQETRRLALEKLVELLSRHIIRLRRIKRNDCLTALVEF